MRLTPPLVCVVTRARGTQGSEERTRLLDRLAGAASAGASMIQIRERQFDDRALAAFIGQVRAVAAPHGTLVVVNDRIDLALAAGADGVHLKSDAPPAASVRRIVPAGTILGRSVHTLEEAVAAAGSGCDYLIFGTVFASSSKPEGHPIAGPGALRAVCRAVTIPVIAIGGVTIARAPEIRDAGAAGAAAISLFEGSRDVENAVRELRSALTLPQRHV